MGRRAEGVGRAGGAAVALARKMDYTRGRMAVLGRKALQTSFRVSM